MTTSTFLTPVQLSARWGGGITVTTLANWRHAKSGPTFIKLGSKVVYALEAVLAFEARTVVAA